MSDRYYLERAARRQRIFWLVAIVIVLVLCAGFGIRNSFYDLCTQSYNRDPKLVVENYLQAVSSGDFKRAQSCWDHNQFYEVGAGCSEICLQRIVGTKLDVKNIVLDPQTISERGRARIQVQITAACAAGNENTGILVLDSVNRQVPWRHWRVIESSVGGSAAEPWCKK